MPQVLSDLTERGFAVVVGVNALGEAVLQFCTGTQAEVETDIDSDTDTQTQTRSKYTKG